MEAHSDALAVGKFPHTLRAAHRDSTFLFEASQRLLPQLAFVEHSFIAHCKRFNVFDWRWPIAKMLPQLCCQWFSVCIEQQSLVVSVSS